MKIELNSKLKINNPTDIVSNDDPNYILSFEGNFNESFFTNSNSEYGQYLKHQLNNYNNLTSYLNSINLHMEHIWLIVFRNNQGSISTSYVIKTNTNNEGLTLYWRKYLSRTVGSGQNEIFVVRNEELVNNGCISNIKVKLTSFLEYPEQFLRDVSNVETMEAMFSETTKFNQPLNNWNVSNVKNMFKMFTHAIKFNQELDKWNVSNVICMEHIFLEQILLINITVLLNGK